MFERPDLGKLLLRMTLGGLLLFHGLDKLFNGTAFIESLLVAQGLPASLAYLVYFGELIAPMMVILGFHSRIGALIIAINMVVAIALVHLGEVMTLTRNGGLTLELQVMYLVTAITVFFLGPGVYKIKN